MTDTLDTIRRALCREKCAFYGDKPCFELPGAWPNSNCDEPGCDAQARAAFAALFPDVYKFEEPK